MNASFRAGRLLVPVTVVLIVGLGAVLRFFDLPFRGFIYWDEAKFALEGIRIEASLQSVFGEHVYTLAGKSVGTAKPTHALLFALAYLLFGVHDYVALGLDALASTLSIALLFVVARKVVGIWVALGATLLLAVSEYDIIYARSGLSESDATFFFLAAFAIWCCRSLRRSGTRLRYRSTSSWSALPIGILLGIAFTTNYRVIVYAGLLILIDLYLNRRAGPVLLVSRLGIWVVGALAAPAIWQAVDLVTHAHGLTLFGNELGSGWRSYFSQVIYQLHEGKQSGLNFKPAPYLQWFAVRQGWWQLVLLLLGLVVALVKRRELEWLIPAIFVVVPYGVYVFAPFTVPRSLVTALPFAMLLIAATLVSAFAWLGSVVSRRGRSVSIAGLVLVLIAATSAAMSWRLTSLRSGFTQAVRYVESRSSRTMTSSEIVLFYMRGSGSQCQAPALPLTPGQLAAYVQVGYRLAVLERHHSSQIAHFVRTRAIRVGHFPALGDLRVGEDLISSENSNPPSNDYLAEYVDVYRFTKVPAKSTPNTVVSCSRDHVT